MQNIQRDPHREITERDNMRESTNNGESGN